MLLLSLMKLLLIEDDVHILSLLQKGFNESGYVTDSADNGEDGEYLVTTNSYDIIILDWMLPLKNGLKLLETLRQKNIDTPILMLTAKDTTTDKIDALQSGCDDYLSKPFEFKELEARVEALHRRYNKNYTNQTLILGDIKIDLKQRTLLKGTEEVHLSSKEQSVLFFLIKHKNSYVSKSFMEEMLYNTDQQISSNVVSVTIHNLRKKIGDKIIKNFRGLGYKIEI